MIGIFDSGFGGLTVFKEIRRLLPQYDYIYLGDNARAPYGNRSFDTVYRFTLQAVHYLFDQGCELVILACNTASAKALRTIQQRDLPQMAVPHKRVLGVVCPTVEVVDTLTKTKHIGILGTTGTIQSESYNLEIAKLHPHIVVTGHACPMWVPLVENGEADGIGADYFVKKEIDAILAKDTSIDALVLACTHYPVLLPKIEQFVPKGIRIFAQGEHVAKSLVDYLSRHPEMESRCSKGGMVRYLTTDQAEKFASLASLFLDEEQVSAEPVSLL